jgi:hypothetical protein
MSNDPSKTLCMVGGHATGKTTFLAAYYVAAEDGGSGVEIVDLSAGDREHLNKMMGRLGRCENVVRTSEQEPQEMRLSLRFEDGGHERLLVPDLSGELIERATEKRRIDEVLARLTIDNDGVLLFLRPDRLVTAAPAQQFNDLLAIAGLDPGPDGPPGVIPSPEDWEIALAPTQVRLVDIVQQLLRLRDGAALRLCLIVSAWDATDDKLSPRDWALENMPLLVQMLDARDDIDWTIFGVSAQGGDFGDEAERARLEAIELIDRPIVLDANRSESTILAPISWALDK